MHFFFNAPSIFCQKGQGIFATELKHVIQNTNKNPDCCLKVINFKSAIISKMIQLIGHSIICYTIFNSGVGKIPQELRSSCAALAET